MCTVAFFPLPDGGFLLGHNRDELRTRAPAAPPSPHHRGGRRFLAPRDPSGGGSWIGVNDRGIALCLLNARETDPARLPAEPPSRGRVLWDLLHLDDPEELETRLRADSPSLAAVRAFHLVAAVAGGASGSTHSLRLRWDGRAVAREDHCGPRLYVSSSVDPARVARERGRAWRRLLEEMAVPRAPCLAAWLRSHDPRPGPFTVCMHRPEARTVSRTLVSVGAGGIVMDYHDGQPCDLGAANHRARLTRLV